MPLDSIHLAASTSPLFNELDTIWDEIGEGDDERDEMLLQLEQACLDIYRRKAERSRKYKADLQQFLADAKAEISQLASALGEHAPYEKIKEGNLKQQASAINLILENLRLKKQKRVGEILEIENQVARICAEITGNDQIVDPDIIQADDLTAKKLEELKFHLQQFQTEKNLRLRKVDSHINAIRNLSVVMSLDFEKIMADIHPSLVDSAAGHPKSISTDTLARLSSELYSLEQEKEQRLSRGQKLLFPSSVSIKGEEEGGGREQEGGGAEAEVEGEEEEDASETCSCSTKSFCKTRRCNCFSSGRKCGTECGCDPERCSNLD